MRQETKKYLCVHGHFYQPPRENPWLERIVYQKSARPYHDWNERVTRECYGPNSRSRLHGKENRITKLINNYEYMSFNFGPTLLSWLEEEHPWIYSEILKADAASRERYGGHGNALAQVYNHIIMPLASSRDKRTQIRWGISDFRHRFGRDPEGMWLAETAVDSETLKLMAEEGIKFTILSPDQARSVRPLKMNPRKRRKAPVAESWQDVSGGRIDTTRPYRVFPDKREPSFIDIFFYDGPLSRAIAYEKLLASGQDLLSRIHTVFAGHRDRPILVSVATDGESYGHHSKFGEMALSWLFHRIEQEDEIRLTNYGQFLEQFPPEQEVKIFENTAWSCAHGVGRWQADCGCSIFQRPGWNQKWRAPLREGLNRLSVELSSIFEDRAAGLLRDPWEARDDYIRIMLNQAGNQVDDFMERHRVSFHHEQRTEILRLLESQRMAMYMFTSCGWFFDDISGIEAAQVLMYACRAIDLVEEWSPVDLEKELMTFLARAESNDPEYGHGDKVYETVVLSSRITPSLAAAHHAMVSVAGEPFSGNPLLPLKASLTQKITLRENGIKGGLGHIKMADRRTGRVHQRAYLALHGPGGDLCCMIGTITDNGPAPWMEEFQGADRRGSHKALVDLFSRNTEQVQRFDLNDLIPDTRTYIIQGFANRVDDRIKGSIGTHHESIRDLTGILRQTGEQPPAFLRGLFHILFFHELYDLLRSCAEKTEIDLSDVARLASLCDPSCCDSLAGSPTIKDMLCRQMDSFTKTKTVVNLKNVMNILTMMRGLNVDPDLWEIQNMFYDLYQNAGFMNTLDPGVRAVLRETGHMLGFSMEEIG